MANFDLNKDYFEQIDSMLPHIENTGGFSFNNGLITITTDLYIIARDQLMLDGYLAPKPHEKHTYILTAAGRDFIRKGGYKAKFADEERLKKLNNILLEMNVANAKRVRTTYWWSFGFSVAALLISLALLVLKLRE